MGLFFICFCLTLNPVHHVFVLYRVTEIVSIADCAYNTVLRICMSLVLHVLKCRGSVICLCGGDRLELVRALALPTRRTSPPAPSKALIVKEKHPSLDQCSSV